VDIQLSVLKNLKGPLSKSFKLEDGVLKRSPAAQLYEGIAETCAISDLHGLSNIIDSLTVEHALTFGVCKFQRARVVTQKKMAKVDGLDVVCRDGRHFDWPEGRAVLMLDIDKPLDGSKPMKAMEFDALMCELQPWWPGVARMYRPSASAFIGDASGKDLTGASSLRCYALVDIARNAHAVGINIADAFWRNGYGRIEFGNVGQMLVRCPVDTTVWQPERLDFAGPVVLAAPASQRRRSRR